MIKSAAKVTVEDLDEGSMISILPDVRSWQRAALSVWIVVWIICGFLAILGVLSEMTRENFVFLIVFMGFWAYFLFYAIRALLWINGGAEYLRITDDTLDYKRSWYGYGRVRSYDLGTMKQLGVIAYDRKGFARAYHEAFWTIGGEMIGFEYIGSKVVIGFKLSHRQAEDIVRRLAGAVRRAHRSIS